VIFPLLRNRHLQLPRLAPLGNPLLHFGHRQRQRDDAFEDVHLPGPPLLLAALAASRFDGRLHDAFPLFLRDFGGQVRGLEERLEAFGVGVLDGTGRIRRGIGEGVDDRGELLVRGDCGDGDAAEGLHSEAIAEFRGTVWGGVCGNEAEVREQNVQL
jgi:hypothetical protein